MSASATDILRMQELPRPGQMRQRFLETLRGQIDLAEDNARQVAVLRFDLDGFRKFNEQHGQAAADRLLSHLQETLDDLLREQEQVIWLGADQFALSLFVAGEEGIGERISCFHASLRAPVNIEGRELQPRLSMGVALYPADSVDAEALLLAAESAQIHAKTRGGAQLNYYSDKIHEQARYRALLEKELQDVLARDELFLVYQPKVDSTSGAIKGFEALLRWQHPERGLISPADFVPILEETRMIIEVGDWIFTEVCAALGRWQKAGLTVVPVSVNVSMHQFRQDGFVERIAGILERQGIEPGLIEIEITESCLMDDGQENIEILHRIKAMGMGISIDDFGTGYSSLSYLQRFPIDTLKIDRSFITEVHNRRKNDNAGIVTAIMALSHSLHLDVVAEGVESAHELAFLHALGCRTIQGFLFSKPLPEHAVVELLETSSSMSETLASVRQELQK
ncbi:MAG TPA: bifunctional diguanylate cyclase/phosphodiesterase [Gammaproteobacteria bacterium]|nr:bifunctional diguanylate cyclase/phosphodiesterase [Gammaproteobacteria bacterium]